MEPFAYRLSRKHRERDLTELLSPVSVEQAIQWAMYYGWPPEETHLTAHTGSPIAYRIQTWKGEGGMSFADLLEAAYLDSDRLEKP